ncbi:MAG TPA: ATP-binding protein [Azospirillum sp.]|nr:ATP-binding protein [Azospirillum sp.]
MSDRQRVRCRILTVILLLVAVIDASLLVTLTLQATGPAGLAANLSIATLVGLPALTAYRVFREGITPLFERLPRRADSEHGQAGIRIILGSGAFVHSALLLWLEGGLPQLQVNVIVAALGLALAWLLLLHVLRRPERILWRQIAGNVLDVGSLSLVLHFGGGLTAAWYGVYLWVTFGNGLRYGIPALALSSALSAIGFGAVVLATPYWRAQPMLSVGLLIALLVLPAYVASLISRLIRAKAKAEAASEAKSRFLAVMSHELRTPLNSVLGFAVLLQRTELVPAQYEMVSMIQGSARALLALISNILDFVQIEAGRSRTEEEVFDLWDTVRTSALLLHPQALEKGLDLRVDIDERTPRHVHGMPHPLRQILVNLVGNAVKFTERGHVAVRLAPTTDGAIQLMVEDQGIGIPAAMLDRIFEPFVQADASITRRYGGTGLGLAIVRSLVETLGGSIRVESEPGQGCRFIVDLRFETCGASSALAGAAENERPAEGGDATPVLARLTRRSARVLVVDDNETNRMIVGRLLELEGHSVCHACDGEAALDTIGRQAFDLVLMDIDMPGMSGLEATGMIRLMRLGEPHLPVVALTADATPVMTRRCREAGMDAVLTKPIDPKELLKLVDRISAHAVAPTDRERPDAGPTTVPEKRPEMVLPVIDPRVLQSFATDAAFFRDLVETFRGDSYRVLADMQRCMRAGDARAFRSAAHALKSTAANMGALRLAALLASPKSWAADDLARQGVAMLTCVQDEHGHLLAALERQLAAVDNRFA